MSLRKYNLLKMTAVETVDPSRPISMEIVEKVV